MQPDIATSDPVIAFFEWFVFDADGARYFAGKPQMNRSRYSMSMRIVRFDPETRRGTDESGTVYELMGTCAFCVSVPVVWETWLSDREWSNWQDVTSEYMAPRPTCH